MLIPLVDRLVTHRDSYGHAWSIHHPWRGIASGGPEASDWLNALRRAFQALQQSTFQLGGGVPFGQIHGEVVPIDSEPSALHSSEIRKSSMRVAPVMSG